MVETGEVMSKQALHAKVAEMSKNLLEETKKKARNTCHQNAGSTISWTGICG